MLIALAMANMIVAHEAALTFSSAKPIEEIRSCVADFWRKKPVRVDAELREGGVDVAVGYPGLFRVLDNPKPFWVFHIKDTGTVRTVRIGYNFSHSPAPAEKTIRKVALSCDLTEGDNPI